MLTLEAVREAARAVVGEQGADFVYRKPGEYGRCLYVKADDKRLEIPPGPEDVCSGASVTPCLVGAIIERLGLMTLEIANEGRGIGVLLGDDALGEYELAVRNYLVTLQGEQDAGKPWGGCLRLAEQQV
jgi:hypothetical protein